MELFQQATRAKLRFNSPQGSLSVEDLWDLPLTSKTGKANLDAIGVALLRDLRSTQDTLSLVKPVESGDSTLRLQFDVVKFIIDTKVAERDEAAVKAEKAAKKQRLLEIIDRKTDQELEGKSLEELRAEVNAL